MITQPADSAKKTSTQNINRQVELYSLAAAAAGVSIIALAQSAQGEVVLTRKTIPIPISQYGGTQYLVPLSLNNDGVNDFSFSLYSFAYHSAHRTLRMFPLEGGGAVGKAPSVGEDPLASALVRGAKIGSSAHFSSRDNTDIEDSHVTFGTRSGKSFYDKSFLGNWGGNPKNRYLGVRFLISGQTHYGWIRLTLTTAPHGAMSATITAYAYETVANKPILAGTAEKPTAELQIPQDTQNQGRPSLGMLAAGADAMRLWRSEETSVRQ